MRVEVQEARGGILRNPSGQSALDTPWPKQCSGKAANAKAQQAAGRRGPGRPRKAASVPAMHGLAGILAAVTNSERDRAAMRAALQRVQDIVADTLP